jgi:hypothetical protein
MSTRQSGRRPWRCSGNLSVCRLEWGGVPIFGRACLQLVAVSVWCLAGFACRWPICRLASAKEHAVLALFE